MTLSQLRKKHPKLIYRGFEIKPAEGSLRIVFDFLLEPNLVFTPEVLIPAPTADQESPDLDREITDIRNLRNLAFHLGLVSAISYWKAACPPEFIVEAGYLSPEQIGWWKDLFIHGLGEFFFRNKIDFTVPDFLTMRSVPRPGLGGLQRPGLGGGRGDLILVGGGKDSIVTMETLKTIPDRRNVLRLSSNQESPGKAGKLLKKNKNSVAAAAGFFDPIAVERKIDSRLIQLNKQGYLNGHTPFSAYLAFLGVFVGCLHGFKHVISSNELSADEENLTFQGMKVNHQYSKSYRFEKLFRDYCASYLTDSVEYFSFLRPLYELQIAASFSRYSRYDGLFVSCNLNGGKSWCKNCPKCAFSYLSLFPFMSQDRLNRIFGGALFELPQIQKHILDLAGLGRSKPFDCVGTKDESILAAALAIRKLENQEPKAKSRPAFLLFLKRKLNLGDKKLVSRLEKKVMENWNRQNFLPPEYAELLDKKVLSGIFRQSRETFERPLSKRLPNNIPI